MADKEKEKEKATKSADSPSAPGPPPAVSSVAPVRPPNRPAHDRLMEELTSKQSVKEERRRFLQEQNRILRDKTAQVRKEKEREHFT